MQEFEVVDEDQYPSGGAVGPICRQVAVALRGKSAVGLYDGSHATARIVDFENDLKADAFD